MARSIERYAVRICNTNSGRQGGRQSNKFAVSALVRLLRLVLVDEEKCTRALCRAIHSAKRSELPLDGQELLDFVRAHLGPQLIGELGPHLVFALVNDLKSEIDNDRTGRLTSNERHLEPARIPASFAGDGASDTDDAETRQEGSDLRNDGWPSAKTGQNVSRLRHSNSVALAIGSRDNKRSSHVHGRTPCVVLVGSDRMGCARLARALVGAQFDVSVWDRTSPTQRMPTGSPNPIIAILDVTEVGSESVLHALATTHPAVSVVAWTDAPQVLVERLLSSAPVGCLLVLPKTASSLEIVSCVRVLSGAGVPM
jgi:hypothetical protein